jgi:hypothetical protein
VEEPHKRAVELGDVVAHRAEEPVAPDNVLHQPPRQIRHQPRAARHSGVVTTAPSHLRNPNQFTARCTHNTRHWQLRVLLSDVGEGGRLRIDHDVICLVVNEFQYETTAVGSVETKIAIAFAS